MGIPWMVSIIFESNLFQTVWIAISIWNAVSYSEGFRQRIGNWAPNFTAINSKALAINKIDISSESQIRVPKIMLSVCY